MSPCWYTTFTNEFSFIWPNHIYSSAYLRAIFLDLKEFFWNWSYTHFRLIFQLTSFEPSTLMCNQILLEYRNQLNKDNKIISYNNHGILFTVKTHLYVCFPPHFVWIFVLIAYFPLYGTFYKFEIRSTLKNYLYLLSNNSYWKYWRYKYNSGICVE